MSQLPYCGRHARARVDLRGCEKMAVQRPDIHIHQRSGRFSVVIAAAGSAAAHAQYGTSERNTVRGVLDPPSRRRAKPTNPGWQCQVERFATTNTSDPTLHCQTGVVPLGDDGTGDPGYGDQKADRSPRGVLMIPRIRGPPEAPGSSSQLLILTFQPARCDSVAYPGGDHNPRLEAAYATAPKTANCVFASVVHKRIRMVVSSLSTQRLTA